MTPRFVHLVPEQNTSTTVITMGSLLSLQDLQGLTSPELVLREALL